MKRCFRDYDKDFADELTMIIYKEQKDEKDDVSDIATLVSRDWYDDSAWDLEDLKSDESVKNLESRLKSLRRRLGKLKKGKG